MIFHACQRFAAASEEHSLSSYACVLLDAWKDSASAFLYVISDIHKLSYRKHLQ